MQKEHNATHQTHSSLLLIPAPRLYQRAETHTHTHTHEMMLMIRILLMTLGGLSAVSAARPQPGNTNHVLAPLEPVTVKGGVAEHEQRQLETSETTSSSSSSPSSSTRLEAPRGLSTTPACTKAYDILNNDKGYLDAIGAVFDDARAVGEQAGEKCWKKMKPSVAPLVRDRGRVERMY